MHVSDVLRAARGMNARPKAQAPVVVAWDIETAALATDGEYDLPITCAATATSDGRTVTWQGPLLQDGRFAPCMTPRGVERMLGHLWDGLRRGDTLVTFNGLGFDLPVAAAAADMRALAREIARRHVDVMFAFHCCHGFPVGLAKIAAGMGLGGKVGLSGRYAPALWTGEGPDEVLAECAAAGYPSAGTAEAQDMVLTYVAGDVDLTLKVYQEILARDGEVAWVTRGGGVARRTIPLIDGRLPTVAECLSMPEPDVSWMDDPWPRAKFAGWLEG